MMSTRLPLVVIVGATGTGKTKLSLDLAKRFCGEIIGADSMQIYKKLNIISAKATKEERSIAPHHMIDKLNPRDVCTVVDFRNEAISIIDALFARNKLPIVVGGTNYYIESLLWRILIEDESRMHPWQFGAQNSEISSVELHEKLKQLDPVMASRLHPCNKRKIIRALEVFETKGRKFSEILDEQHSSPEGNSLGGGLRYRNSIIFWLQWQKDTLDARLDKRVDSMMQEGLVDELLDFHNEYNANNSADYTKGVNQIIGIKEFREYLRMSEEERSSADGKAALASGVDELKRVTRRYARKQGRWIKNRFLGRSDREVPPVYALNVDDTENWDERVTMPAIRIVESFIDETECNFKAEEKIDIASTPNSLDESFYCDVCQRTFVGHFQWRIHLKSNKHARVVKSLKKRAQRNDVNDIKCTPNVCSNEQV